MKVLNTERLIYIVSEINNFAYYNAFGAVNAKTKRVLAFTINNC